ncbi:MAG: hypothetical protein KGI29_07835 [Pseudomonadota bacterium]|nr:hypothetical protein [Pseudomonadota bacterium]MDE3036979.1 hypothetical protein [Pseudomonadota bacterium]
MSSNKTWRAARGAWNVKRRPCFTFHVSRFTFLLLAGLLTACGFRPLYGKKTDADPGSRVFAGVSIDKIPDRMGQQLQANLEDRLNPDGAVPANPGYRLAVLLSDSTIPIGVARDGTVSRYNVYLSSTYTLYRTADGKAIDSGTINDVSSYNNSTNDYFSTYISEQDAIKHGVQELSELYRARLAAYLDAGAPVHAVAPKPAGPQPLNPWQPNPWQSNYPTTQVY